MLNEMKLFSSAEATNSIKLFKCPMRKNTNARYQITFTIISSVSSMLPAALPVKLLVETECVALLQRYPRATLFIPPRRAPQKLDRTAPLMLIVLPCILFKPNSKIPSLIVSSLELLEISRSDLPNFFFCVQSLALKCLMKRSIASKYRSRPFFWPTVLRKHSGRPPLTLPRYD